MEQNESGSNTTLKWLVGVLVVVIIGLIGYILYSKSISKPEVSTNTPTNNTVTTTPTNSKTSTSDLKTYTNKDFGFSFNYPGNWQDIILAKQKNIIDSLPGTSIASWTKNGPNYFDPEKVYSFSTDSKDYVAFEGVSYNKMKINTNWTKDEFIANMGIKGFDVLSVRKLSNKSLLVISYGAPECSPGLMITVLTPFTNEYPNFEISIGGAFVFGKDKIVTDYIAKQNAEKKDICYQLEPYKQIAQKIDDGSYSQKLNSQIEIAKTILDSFQIISN